jgi:hypothetical protein
MNTAGGPGLRLARTGLLLVLALCTGYRAEEYSDNGEGEEYRDDGGAAGSDGCLVLDGPTMHEFGSELAFLHVGLGACNELASSAGQGAELVWHLDGEELGRKRFLPETVRLTMPLDTAAGAHELVVSLRARRAPDEGEHVLDEAVYTFFTADFRPHIDWEFPPEGYTFKRNSQRFLRFQARDASDQERCQEGAASCAGPEPFIYHAAYYLNGHKMGEGLRQIYMLGLSGLGDGEYEALVELSDKHHQPLGVNHSVHFAVKLDDEYVEDGGAGDAAPAVTPCPTDVQEVCAASPDGGNTGGCSHSSSSSSSSSSSAAAAAAASLSSSHSTPTCGARGVAVGGVCRCAADYIGDDCEHHLLSSRHKF